MDDELVRHQKGRLTRLHYCVRTEYVLLSTWRRYFTHADECL